MKLSTFKLLCSIFTITIYFQKIAFAQNGREYWSIISKQQLPRKGGELVVAKQATYYKLNFQAIKDKLSSAPNQSFENPEIFGLKVELPLENGNFGTFYVFKNNLLPPDLAQKYSDINTLSGIMQADPSIHISITVGVDGLHYQVAFPTGDLLLDPIYSNDQIHYILYNKNQLEKTKEFECIEQLEGKIEKQISPQQKRFTTDDTLRQYRLAVSATGEFTTLHGGHTKTFNKLVNVVNRLNTTYKRDFAISFVLASKTDTIIFSNANTDPYSNNTNTNNIYEIIMRQNQRVCDSLIGKNNYDIGHLFANLNSTIGIGLGSACTSNKAQGFTSTTDTINDVFIVDFIMHEIGHQFKAYHTYSGNTNSCSNGHWWSSAVEPGSGLTIMGYAGLCGLLNNLGNHSYNFFHNASIRQVVNYVQLDSGRTCGFKTKINNTRPNVSINMPVGIKIPHNTPYKLTGSATDAQGDTLTYSWEQTDTTNTPIALATIASSNVGACTRYIPPSSNGNVRTVPEMKDLLYKRNLTGNSLSSVSRNMTFELTVRDNKHIGGKIGRAEYKFEVVGAAGPFQFTNLKKRKDTIRVNDSLAIRWDVANTYFAPINCTKVKVLMSKNNGKNFNITLADSTANNGIFKFAVTDSMATDSARFLIEAVKNIFFNVNDSALIIKKHCAAIAGAYATPVNYGIVRVKLNQLDNVTDISSNKPYNQYPGVSTLLLAGRTYPLTIFTGPDTSKVNVAAYIDYNNNTRFDEYNEMVLNENNVSGNITKNINIPTDTNFLGIRRMRIKVVKNQPLNNNSACDPSNHQGEIEDYDVLVKDYCKPKGNCFSYRINNFYLLSCTTLCYQNNGSCPPNGYRYFSQHEKLGRLPFGKTVNGRLNMVMGYGKHKIWIDYNDDGDFLDSDELVATSPANNDSWVFQFNMPNNPNIIGIHKLRVISAPNNGAAGPCTNVSEGEIIDMFIEIYFDANLVWNFDNAFCPGTQLSVAFVGQSTLPSGYSLSVLLSNKNGQFAPGTIIGTGSTSPILCTLPHTLEPGSNYKLALYSEVFKLFNPSTQSMGILSKPKVDAVIPNNPRIGDTITIQGQRLLDVQEVLFDPDSSIVAYPFIADILGTYLKLVVPIGAVSGRPLLIGECNTRGPMITVRPPCNFQITDQYLSPSASPECESGAIGLTIGGIIQYGGIVTLYKMPENVEVASKAITSSGYVLFEGLRNGTYKIVISSDECTKTFFTTLGDMNCQFQLTNVVVETPAANQSMIRFTPVHPSCHNLKFNLKRYNPSTLVWATISIYPNLGPGIDEYNFSPLSPGTYRLVVTGVYGICGDSVTLTIPGAGNQLPPPVITPGSGQYNSLQTVQITSSEPECQIYYTLNGSNPVVGSNNSFTRLYNGPFKVGTNTTIKAISVKSGFQNSQVATVTLTFSTPLVTQPVTANPAPGTYQFAQNVALQTATTGAKIYFTTNGNVPLLGSSFTFEYTQPIFVNGNVTIRAIAMRDDLMPSSVFVGNYNILNPTPKLVPPQISPAQGTYSTIQTVTFSHPEPGVTIYYTTNGNTPLIGTPNTFTHIYTGPIQIFSTTQFTARAVKAGFINSDVVKSTITIDPPAFVEPVIFIPQPGVYLSQINLMMQTATPGAAIYYTTNGNIPRIDIPNFYTRLYSTPLFVNFSTLFRAFAVKPGMRNSVVTTANYIITYGARYALDTVTTQKPIFYPNPTYDNIQVLLPEINDTNDVNAVSISAKLYDFQGRLLMEKSLAREQQNNAYQLFDLRKLPKGIYQIQLKFSDKLYHEKIVKH